MNNEKKLILLTQSYASAPLEIIRSALSGGFELLVPEKSDAQSVLELIERADYLLAGGRVRLTGEMLDRATRLKMIQRSGVGLDALDLEAIRLRGIPLYVNRGINAESVAEHALLLMLACLRRLNIADCNTKNGVWKKQEHGIKTRELRGKTVGLIGMGAIARTLVKLLKPFNVNIFYTDVVRAGTEFESENNLRYVEMNELLSQADIVSLHCALTDETRQLINKDTIDLMKPGAILINTARGGMIDTVALYDALKRGRIGYAGLDVHETEPIGADYCLKLLENVILTPHIAGVTADSFESMMREAFRNIECFENGDLDAIAESKYL